MTKTIKTAAFAAAAAIALAVAAPVLAQDATQAAVPQAPVPQAATPDAPGSAEQFLKVYFPSGSATIGSDQLATLDSAARTFRDGNPFVMIVSGGADTVGNPQTNLDLSLRRAKMVAEALTARGIPVDRLQVLGRGNSELDVATGADVAEPQNRSVEISWK